MSVNKSGDPASLLASALRAFFTTGVIEGNMMAPPNDEIVPSHSGSGGRTTLGASHPRSKLLQRAAGAVWSRGALLF
ncbi:hypothetical protein Tco_0562998 [Tanacetum coccineum]